MYIRSNKNPTYIWFGQQLVDNEWFGGYGEFIVDEDISVGNIGLRIINNDDTLKISQDSLINITLSGFGNITLLNNNESIYTFPEQSTTLLGSDITQSFSNKSGSFIQIQIPSTGSAPAFVPAQESNKVTLFYNTSSNFLYAYSNGTWVSKSFV